MNATVKGTVTTHAILTFEGLKLLCVLFTKYCEIHIQGHSKNPEQIGRSEPQ